MVLSSGSNVLDRQIKMMIPTLTIWRKKRNNSLLVALVALSTILMLTVRKDDNLLHRLLMAPQEIQTPNPPDFLYDILKEEGDSANTDMINLLKTVAFHNLEMSGSVPHPEPPIESEHSQLGKPHLTCPEGQIPHSVLFTPDVLPQTRGTGEKIVTLANGNKMIIRTFGVNQANPTSWVSYFTHLYYSATIPILSSVPNGGLGSGNFPDAYAVMELVLEKPVDEAFISVQKLESFGSVFSQAVRFRTFDADHKRVYGDYYKTDPDTYIKGDFAYRHPQSSSKKTPGMGIGLFPQGRPVRTIAIDHSLVALDPFYVGQTYSTAVQIALEICSVPDLEFGETDWAVPMAPVPTLIVSEDSLTSTSSATIAALTKAAARAASKTPSEETEEGTMAVARMLPTVPAQTESSADSIFHGNVLLKTWGGEPWLFRGRSGSWYSAASTTAFHWNVHTQKFEGCPSDSDTFVTGMGLTFYNDNKEVSHKMEINVVNEFNTDTGCGSKLENKADDYSCLGAGSLELVVDGRKITKAIDYKFADGTGRVLAFNTVGKCSRSWFAMEELGESTGETVATVRGRRRRRRLQQQQEEQEQPGDRYKRDPIDILEHLKPTMIAPEGCKEWMEQRKENHDLLQQTGTWSTIIVETDKVSFYMEYKQEQERCHAHMLDIWVMEVDSNLVKEEWKGLIGETKGQPPLQQQQEEEIIPNGVPPSRPIVSDNYEVLTPFSTQCPACLTQRT